MLLAEAQIATPYMYNYHYYHYVSNPFIQELRARYMQALIAARPRFIIEVDDELRPTGIDTTDSFPALESFVDENYAVVLAGAAYRIYERKGETKRPVGFELSRATEIPAFSHK